MSFTEIRPYYETYGQVRYFHSDRCFNTEEIKQYHKGKIKAKEIVTYDCGLMELYEMETEEETPKAAQIIAMIVRPATEPDESLKGQEFLFCGYDLADVMTAVSVITNCGLMFSDVIDYDRLNEYGLISNYKDALSTQQNLQEEYPEESHSDCEIVEVWRKLIFGGLKIDIGIMEEVDYNEDYSSYEPEKYHCVSLKESYLDDWWNDLSIIKSYFHNLRRPSLAVARYGVTIFPPESLAMLQDIVISDKRINKDKELQQAAFMIGEAISRKKHMIVFGI